MRKIKILAPILILGSIGAVTCSLASCSCSRSDHQHYVFTSENQFSEYLEANKVENADQAYSFKEKSKEEQYEFISNNINFKVIRNGLLYTLSEFLSEKTTAYNLDANLYTNRAEFKLEYTSKDGQSNIQWKTSFDDKVLTTSFASEATVQTVDLNYDFSEDEFDEGSHYIKPTYNVPTIFTQGGRELWLYYDNGVNNATFQKLEISPSDWENVTDWSSNT